jgi:ribosomal protein S18 acetylase RimI-like enzyme
MKNAYPIRPAGLLDLRPLHRLIHSAYRGAAARSGWTHEANLLGGGRLPRALLAEILRDKEQRMLVACDGELPVGCVQIRWKKDRAAYIGLLTVEPRLQGDGLGRRLLRAAEQLAHEEFGASHAEMMVIKQRRELIDYYERRGFRLTGEERPFPHGDPRFGLPKRGDLAFAVLEKTLPHPGQPPGPAPASDIK